MAVTIQEASRAFAHQMFTREDHQENSFRRRNSLHFSVCNALDQIDRSHWSVV